jgi:MOB kinase activator 1
MSGFITTMFVSSPTNLYPSYPAKPESLRPIFTFAQSQSCMNLRMDMDVLDCQEKGMAGERMALELAIPKETYQNPLQRIGEALRIPRLGLDTSLVALAPTPRKASQVSADAESPTREMRNYSYKLLSSGPSSSALSETEHHAALGLALDHQDSLDTGSIIGPYTRRRCKHRATRAILRAQAYFLLSLVTHGLAHPSSRRRRTEAQAAGSSSNMRRLHSVVGA